MDGKEELIANIQASLETPDEFIAESNDFIDDKEPDKETNEQSVDADNTS